MRLTLVAVALLSNSILAGDVPKIPGPPKIGDKIGNLTFTDIRSLKRTLDDFGKPKAYVLVFTSTTCPLAQRYLPTLKSLDADYGKMGVQFISVNSSAVDTIIGMATMAVKYDVPFPFVKDFDCKCADALGVTRTPEAVVLAADRTLLYRGRIDDQYRTGGHRPTPSTREVQDALDAVLAGRLVTVATTEVDGCPIEKPKPRLTKAVNFAEHVAPILKQHCWDCHRDGGSAPFTLTTHKSASARAKAIVEVVRDQRMPPWFATHDFGPFANVRGLTDAERHTLEDWLKSDTPAGDTAKLPAAPPKSDAKWKIGEPDLILKTNVVKLPAAGDVQYLYAVLPHVFEEETWITNAQIQCDVPQALHHCNMAWGNIKDGFSAKNFITGQVPNGEPMDLDPGVAVKIPKNSVLALEMHFVTTGKPEACRVSVGINFPKTTVKKQMNCLQLEHTRFAIPAGDPHHAVKKSLTFASDVELVGLFSHMHVRGKDMTFTATPPNGSPEELLIVANYNFNWQIPYRYAPGKKTLPKGTRMDCVAHYDNSPFNPYNPDPKKTVKFGLQTHEEMMMGFVFYTSAGEKLDLKVDPKTGVAVK